MAKFILNEEQIRKIIRDRLSEGEFGRVTSSLGTTLLNPFGVTLNNDNVNKKNRRTGKKSNISFNVDESKLDSRIDLNSVKEMSSETGLRPDFVYGIQSRESAGKYSAMALNPHITIGKDGYKWATKDAGLEKFKGSEGKKKWNKAISAIKAKGVEGRSIPGVTAQGFNHPVYKKMRDVDPELAILGNALGLYQVLGGHLLPYWNYSAEQLENDFKDKPREVSNKAFVIWVKKHKDFVRKVNKSEDNWRKQIARYYGADNVDYTNHVLRAAKQFRDAQNQLVADGVTDSWKGKENKIFAKGINFHKLIEGGTNNYRSGMKPKHVNATPEFFAGLAKDFGIETVITLNADNAGKKASEAAESAGLNVMYAPSSDSGGSLNIKNYTFDDIAAQLDRGHNLIHCTHGADRTGAIVGRYYVTKGMSVKDALKDAYKYKSGGESKFMTGPTEFIKSGKQSNTLSEGSFGRVTKDKGSDQESTSSDSDMSSSDKPDPSKLKVSKGKVGIIGDSQVGNGLGKWIKNRFSITNERVSMLVSGHAGTVVNQPSFNTAAKDAELVIITLGGHPSNKSSNCKELLDKIYELAPNASIVWIGAPPAFEPKSNNSMVSKDKDSENYWLNKRKSRCNRNKQIIQKAVDAHNSKQPTYFINPCDDLTVDTYKPSGDGIHVPSGYGNFLEKYLGGFTPTIS